MFNIAKNTGQFYIGVVEDRSDPLMLGRCKVRVVGLHTHDKLVLPTTDLPWAMLMQPATSAGVSGIGQAPVGPVEGTTVIVIFHDFPDNQQPIIIGSLSGIPQGEPVVTDRLVTDPIFTDNITPSGRPIPTTYLEVNAGQATPIEGSQPIMQALTEQSLQLQANLTGLPIVQLQGATNAIGFLPGVASVQAGIVGNFSVQIGGLGTAFGALGVVSQNIGLALGAIDQTIGSIVNVANGVVSLKNQVQAAVGNITNLVQSIPQQLESVAQQTIANALSPLQNALSAGISLQLGATLSTQGLQGSLSLGAGLNFPDVVGALNAGVTGAVNTAIGSVTNVVNTTIGTVTGTINNIVGTALGTVTNAIGMVTGLAAQIQTVANLVSNVEGMTVSLSGQVSGVASGISCKMHGLTNGALVIADTVGDVKVGLSSAVNFITATPVTKLLENSVKGEAVMSIALPEATAVGGHTNITTSPSPPSGVFASAGTKATTQMVSPLPDVTPQLSGSAPASQTSPSSPQSVNTGGIPTTPPPWFKGDVGKASQSIQALLAAADKYGLSTREQKAALLGICGGECNWMPVREGHIYSSPDRLLTTFQSTFRGNRSLAEKYANWKGSKEEFFRFVYAPENNGKRLGNTQPDDGAKFFGRGLIQVTGRPNYERYSALSGKDLVSNPDLLVNNLTVSAEVAVLYLKDRVKRTTPPTSHPGYFEAAARAVNGIYEIEKKRRFYEYFYGTSAPETFQYEVKEAGAEAPSSYSGRLGQQVQGSRVPLDGQGVVLGFCDPHGKYPLKSSVYQQDSNSLARGFGVNTVVSVKESKRTRGITLPFGMGVFDQPQPAYSAKYPFNHVYESESGHIQEFDDTPGAERIHTYHRSGTFSEIDAGGNQVNKIVGDGYVIYDKNGFIHIAGEAVVHAIGNINVYCQSDANIHVEGSADIEVGGTMDMKAARDFNIACGGKFNVWANQGINMGTDKETHMFSVGKTFISAINDLEVLTGNKMHLETAADLHIKSNTFARVETTTGFNLKCKGMYLTSQSFGHILTEGGSLYIGSSSNIDLKASGDINLDGTNIMLNSGTAEMADPANPAVAATLATPNPLPTVPQGKPVRSPNLGMDVVCGQPSTYQHEIYHYETPQDYNSPGAKTMCQQDITQNGHFNAYEGESVEYNQDGGNTVSPTGGSSSVSSVDDSEIMNMPPSMFTANYRLSTHFTLGMMFDGGFNINHRLQAQNGLTVNQIVANLANLCQNVLEPLIEKEILPGGIQGRGKQWQINSGYRMGAASSQHNRGMAVDFGLHVGTPNRRQKTFELIQQVEKAIPYDQLILEYRGASVWIHCSFNAKGNRKHAFTMNMDKTVDPSRFRLLA